MNYKRINSDFICPFCTKKNSMCICLNNACSDQSELLHPYEPFEHRYSRESLTLDAHNPAYLHWYVDVNLRTIPQDALDRFVSVLGDWSVPKIYTHRLTDVRKMVDTYVLAYLTRLGNTSIKFSFNPSKTWLCVRFGNEILTFVITDCQLMIDADRKVNQLCEILGVECVSNRNTLQNIRGLPTTISELIMEYID